MNAPDLPAAPIISIPATLDEDYQSRLRGPKNRPIQQHTNHDYIDVGDATLVHLVDAGKLLAGIRNHSLVDVLKDLAGRCEYPVLMVVGNPYGRPPIDVMRNRSIAGFSTHLELFTRIRALHAPDRFHAVMMINLLAKQAQHGFTSLGLEDL